MNIKKILALLGICSIITGVIVVFVVNKEKKIDPQVVTEVVIEEEIPEELENIVEVVDVVTEEDNTEPTNLVDKNLITAIVGKVFVINADQTLFQEPSADSAQVGTYVVDTEIEVSGIYGTTGFAQVVKKGTSEILGYINSDFISNSPTKVVSVEVDGVTEDNIDDFMSQGTPLTDAEYQALLEIIASQGAPDMGGDFVYEGDTGWVSEGGTDVDWSTVGGIGSKYDSVTTD